LQNFLGNVAPKGSHSMSTAIPQANKSNGTSSARDLFALTDEQILQIVPDARDIEVFDGERSDSADPLREDLELLASGTAHSRADHRQQEQGNTKTADEGLNPVATITGTNAAETNAQNASANSGLAGNAEAPQWLAERMNDPQHGAEARELWQGVQTARQEAAALREVFAKPEDARAAADRARTLDEIDRAYFGAAGDPPEQTSASRAQLAAMMMREDPAAFREMVFAGLRALEDAGKQGSSVSDKSVPPPFRAASSAAPVPPSQTPSTQISLSPAQAPAPHEAPPHQATPRPQEAQHQQETQRQQVAQHAQEARVAAYAAFERAANEDLERGVGAAIERSLQQALPNASRSENGAGLKQRLAEAVRQDVEKALQGDRALGEQVARMMSGQRLDSAARAQVVRLIGERAQQLVPGATRRVLADWTQSTLSAHATQPRNAAPRPPVSETSPRLQSARREPGSSTPQPRRIDYRRVSDDDILNS
jgi:hypothetical protein